MAELAGDWDGVAVTDTWGTTGVVVSRSRDTPGTYEGLSYGVLVNIPGSSSLLVPNVVPEPGQRWIDDSICDVVPLEIGEVVRVFSVGEVFQFFFVERPLMGEC